MAAISAEITDLVYVEELLVEAAGDERSISAPPWAVPGAAVVETKVVETEVVETEVVERTPRASKRALARRERAA